MEAKWSKIFVFSLFLPGEGGPLSGVEGVSELFDGVVLTRQAEDALLIQAVFLDVLHTLLDQDRHHVRPKPLLICDNVHEALSKHCKGVLSYILDYLNYEIRKRFTPSNLRLI